MSTFNDHNLHHRVPSTRRKSFNIFSRPTILGDHESVPWTSTHSDIPPRPKSLFGVSGLHEISAALPNGSSTPRPKVLTKGSSHRPRSVFGSLKGRDATPPSPVVASSASSSMESSNLEVPTIPTMVSSTAIFSGELITGGGLLRKKRDYVVLTNRELLRYKSEQKFTEAFGGARAHGRRASSVASVGEVPGDHALILRLEQAVAVFHTGPEAEAGNSIQIDYIDTVGSPCSVVLQAATPTAAQQWVDKIRSMMSCARMDSSPTFMNTDVEYVIRRVEAERDYAPHRFRIFRVVQRAGKPGSKTGSLDDLQKLYSTICYLAIGLHKVHLIPVCSSTNKSMSSPQTMTATSHAILNLASLSISELDDSFTLSFRSPCRAAQKLSLASADGPDIIQSIRQLHEYLLPLWHNSPYVLDIPDCMKLVDEPLPEIPVTPGDDLGGFDRTLAAFCTAYELDASNIVYGVVADVEDGPQFVLYPPQHSRRRQYSDLELLAILRTLRWNESFGSISFRGILLDPLNNVFDEYGSEFEPRQERASGRGINLKSSGVEGKSSVLVHELRAIALYSGKLRRVDFSECFKARNREGATSGTDDFTSVTCTEKACPVLEAIMPLCKRGLTNLDWFILSGVNLGEPDLDWLVDAAASRLAHFRGFEFARCGLTERMITLFLNALTTHETTIEALDLSGNPARIYAPNFNNAMCYFPFIRKLNVSRILRTAANEAALTTETLLRWRLEDLDLSETKLNPESVDAVASYLATEKSSSLRHLVLTQCGLTAGDVAVLMHSMTRTPGKARDLHLYIGQNPLAQTKDLTQLVKCIRDGSTPSHLTMRMVDYPKEELFQELVRAFTVNKTIVYLDISKTSLPFEAGEQTCAELGRMFAENTTLKEIDLSGEQAVLESASLGKGVCKSLARLAENRTLEVLRIELQALNTPGAMELASLIGKNSTLREIHCDQNEFHLQGFTAMVNAVEHNHTLTFVSPMDHDRAEHMRMLKEKLFQSGAVRAGPNSTLIPNIPEEKKKSSLRRGSKRFEKRVAFSAAPDGEGDLSVVGVETSLMLLEGKWISEKERLFAFLGRNTMESQRRKWTLPRLEF